MKKFIALASILALALCVIACGDDGKKEGCLNCACKTGNICDSGLKCTNSVCVACTAGTLDCPCKAADPKCDGALVCTDGTCKTSTACCAGEALHMSVEGTVIELKLTGAPDGVSIPLAAVSPVAALTSAAGTNPAPIEAGAITTSTATGVFTLDCFDVTDVALGLIILADDTGTTYFPAFTGVAGWSDPSQATCLTGTRVFAMKTEVVTQLAALINATYPAIDPDFDPATSGIILGMTMGPPPSAMPTGDVTVLKEVTGGSPEAIPNICYVTMDPTTTPPSLKCGTKTSAMMGGLFVIPGPFGGGLSPPTLIGEKTGCTWASGRFKASTANGKAFVIGLIADSCS